MILKFERDFIFAVYTMRQRLLLFFILISGSLGAWAQGPTDSTEKVLEEVVITGTRTENSVRNLPMPIQVISAGTIAQTGIENLLDLLQMKTGLVVAINPLGVSLQGYPNPFGTGIQMQGLDPAYTLILIDGEPLTGRNAGILDLGRIALGNIKQIEILRGPATSLYGSDALAGVINIITQEPVKNSLNGRLHYGSNNEQALSLTGSVKLKKTSLELLARRFSNNGWDYQKDIYGKTMDPYRNTSLNLKSVTKIDSRNTLVFSGRYFVQRQFNDYLIAPDNVPEVVTGTTIEDDKSIYGKWDHKINNRFSYITSLYATGFKNNSGAFLEKNDSLYEKITLSQLLLRPEIQVNYGKKGQEWVTGAGYNYESINSNRYSSIKRMDAWFAYLQRQITFSNSVNIIAGARFDKNSLYDAQLSPKFAAAYKVTPDIILKASVGAGFKAPDFRQQFLDFSNSLVGYTIIGARELGNGLERLQNSGLLSKGIDISSYIGGRNLEPERSVGINIGADYTINPNLIVKANLFRNDINHLIESYSLPFTQLNNKEIFSYMNLNKVYTEGAELSVSYHLNRNFYFNAGYNFLIAKDKQVIKDIKEHKIYRRNPYTGKTTLVQLSDYKGLYNRSKNTANFSLQYSNIRYGASVNIEAKYRGRYGFQGINGYSDGNLILDNSREFADGFCLINIIARKELGKHFEVQSGVQNLLNYIQPALMPSQFGRGYFINMNFKF